MAASNLSRVTQRKDQRLDELMGELLRTGRLSQNSPHRKHGPAAASLNVLVSAATREVKRARVRAL
jgi:hypothetical protein